MYRDQTSTSVRVAIALAILLAGCIQAPDAPPGPVDVPSYKVPEALGWVWEEAAPLPRAVAGAACTSTRDAIYVIGGIDHRGLVRPEIQVHEDGWTPGGSLPMPLHGAAATTSGGLRVIGGYRDVGGSVLSDVVYERNVLDFWDEGGRLPQPTAEAAVVQWGPSLYVLGGTHDGLTASDSIYVQTRSGVVSSWSEAGTLATARAAAAPAVHNASVVILAGGWESPGVPITSSHGQGLDGQIHWEGPAVPTPRTGTATAAIGPFLFIIGGEDSHGNVTGTAELLDLEQGAWWALPPLPAGREDACAVVTNGAIHVLGGRDQDGDAQPDHWVLRNLVK